MNGGIISELTRAIKEEGSITSEIRFDIKVLKGSIGGNDKEKIKLYHELLNKIETSLADRKILTDINNSFENSGESFNDFLKKVPSLTYIKSTG